MLEASPRFSIGPVSVGPDQMTGLLLGFKTAFILHQTYQNPGAKGPESEEKHKCENGLIFDPTVQSHFSTHVNEQTMNLYKISEHFVCSLLLY